MNIEVAVKNLREVKDVFDKNGISYWLDTGTLLGTVRDGKIIEWDTDIDLGAWYNSVAQLISIFPELKKRGFDTVLNRRWAVMTIRKIDCNINVSLYRERDGYAWKIWRIPKEGVIISILDRCVNISNLKMYTKEGRAFTRKIKHLSSLLPSALKRLVTGTAWLALHRLGCMIPTMIPKRYFEKLSTIRFYGMQFNAPSNVEKYLEYRYGNDWKTPKRKWIHYKDDGAVAPDRDWLCLEN